MLYCESKNHIENMIYRHPPPIPMEGEGGGGTGGWGINAFVPDGDIGGQ